MPQDQDTQNNQHDGHASPPSRLAYGKPTSGGGKTPGPPNGNHNSSGGDQPPTYKTLWREIRWLDIINVGVAVAMLIVAIATYRIATDTKDVKDAIHSISDLAKQTKRQADNSDTQVKALGTQFAEMKQQTKAFQASAGAAQGQLNESRIEQRAWILVESFLEWSYVKDAQGNNNFMMFPIANLTNNGNSPATEIATFLEPFWFKPTFELDSPNQKVISMADQRFDPNTTCDRLPKASEYQTVFPKREPLGVTGGYASEPAIPEYFTGHAFYGFRGCVRYKTLGTLHITKFCTVYQHDPEQPPQNGRWGLCPGKGQEEAN